MESRTMAMKLEDSIDTSITTAIRSDLSHAMIDFSEIGLDNILNDGIFKDIPVIGTLVALAKTGLNIKDRLFIKKLLLFFNGLSIVPLEVREKFIKYNYSGKEEYLGQKLLMIIDGLDDFEKPTIISMLFKAYINGCIDKQMFFRLSLIVQKCYLHDLLFLEQNCEDTIKGYKALNLYNNSLVEISNFSEVEEGETEYKINYVGKQLIQYGFGKE